MGTISGGSVHARQLVTAEARLRVALV